MNKRVLIIEADCQVGMTIQNMVEVAGHRATHVCTVDAALTVLSREHADVILTNQLYVSTLRMMSLPWLVKQIQPTVSVVLTAAGEPVDVNAFSVLDGYLRKPFGVADVGAVLARLPSSPVPSAAMAAAAPSAVPAIQLA